jgi:hypothetical protein
MKKLNQILSDYPYLNSQDTGTDKNTNHSYIENFYEQEFAKYQEKNIDLLEIGINKGGSLFLWSKFFNNANIYGLDITDAFLLENYKNINRVTYIFKNAYTKQVANELPDFDIIIDDGPHSLESQIDSINLYISKLKKDGIFIIEDIQSIEYINILNRFIPEELKNKTQVIDLRSKSGRFDDIMLIIRK